MWTSLPLFGNTVVLAVLLAASYTFAVALAAGSSGRPRTLAAARLGAYGTACLIGVAALCLAYALVTHDFRLRYVAAHSDRSMPTVYLVAAFWGGQDGSILWWLFLLGAYIGACVRWLGDRYLELQPYILATLMVVVMFFCVVMTFSANPFAESLAGATTDGQGMNALLQNYWMTVHPPCLYAGFVGCTVPFAFAIAALVTGRLDDEWIVACRKWALFAWLFLAIGNVLGALWAYESLGWGGYWGWDPVENASFLPLLTATALIHSVMIQERRGLLKVWNIFLVCLTFFLTIFGTYLTRSGVIASVHSFARSSIGNYFLAFLALLFVTTATLTFYRWPELRGLTASARLRRATLITGWTLLALYGPGLYVIGSLPASLGLRALLMGLGAGAFAFVGLEICFRRMTRDLALAATRPEIESVLSRDFVFLLNNWSLLGLMLFVLIATTFPLVTGALWNETVTVGPLYYNAWVPPIGLTIYVLMGVGTLFGWKKTSPAALGRAIRFPLAAFVLAGALQLVLGGTFGLPPVVWAEPVYTGVVGRGLRAFNAWTPVLGLSLAAFNATVIAQEFALLFRARRRSSAGKGTPAFLWYAGILPGFFHTLFTLPPPSRRRYGGYIVHLGVVMAFVGFTGRAWTIDREASLAPGQTFHVGQYDLTYQGPRVEADVNRRTVFADLHVSSGGNDLGALHPAKAFYAKSPEAPVTQVSMHRSIGEDLYVIVGTVNLETRVATLQVHVNPLVSWIWYGTLVLIFGTVVCMWPRLAPDPYGAWAYGRNLATAAATLSFALLLALFSAPAYAQGGMDDMHSHTVRILNDHERDVFASLRCMCGCPRDLLSTCSCESAEAAREAIRKQLLAGMTKEQILLAYQQANGVASLAVPPDAGALRAIYAVPLVAIVGGAAGLGFLVRRWRARGGRRRAVTSVGLVAATDAQDAEYDARLDAELRDLDD
jgi:cytochrome c-type biogenesis protein CcmF